MSSLGGDRRGGLWIGTGGGDLLRFDPAARSWRKRSPRRRERRPRHQRDPGWIHLGGTHEGSCASIRKQAGPGCSGTTPTSNESGARVRQELLEDREGRLWVGTGEGGLQRLDAEGRVLERFRLRGERGLDPERRLHHRAPRGSPRDAVGRDPLRRAQRVRSAHEAAIRYQPVPGRSDSLSHHTVTSIFEDSKGRLWIGTAGGGLNRVEEAPGGQGERFARFTTAEGLADNNVMAILEDDDGTLWLSTKRGLSRFDPATGLSRISRCRTASRRPSSSPAPLSGAARPSTSAR